MIIPNLPISPEQLADHVRDLCSTRWIDTDLLRFLNKLLDPLEPEGNRLLGLIQDHIIDPKDEQ